MRSLCRYCLNPFEDMQAHVASEHPDDGPPQPINLNPRLDQCPECNFSTEDVEMHIMEYHCLHVLIYVGGVRHRLSRYSDGKFRCPCCHVRHANALTFRVSNAFRLVSACPTQFLASNSASLSSRVITFGVLEDAARLMKGRAS